MFSITLSLSAPCWLLLPDDFCLKMDNRDVTSVMKKQKKTNNFAQIL